MNLVHSKHRYATKMHVETYGYNLKLYSRCGDTGKEPLPSPSLFSLLHHFRDPQHLPPGLGNKHSQNTVLPKTNKRAFVRDSLMTSEMLQALGLVYPTQGPL